jgi:NAD(P) transhydrogenase subunit alpha
MTDKIVGEKRADGAVGCADSPISGADSPVNWLLPVMIALGLCVAVGLVALPGLAQHEDGTVSTLGQAANEAADSHGGAHGNKPLDYWSMVFVFVLATFIGVGVIRRVSRLLHTPLMSITNAISAIAVVGSIVVTGADYPLHIRLMGFVALFASMTNIVSGFLITDRMLKMFKKQ